MLGLSIVPALAQLACVLSLPESPRWLLARKDEAGARDALRELRGEQDVAAELREIKQGLERERAASGAAASAGVGALWKPGVRRVLLVCSSLQMFQQLCGVNAIVYFTPQILKQAGTQKLFLGWGVSEDVAAMLATVLAYLPKIPSVRARPRPPPPARAR